MALGQRLAKVAAVGVVLVSIAGGLGYATLANAIGKFKTKDISGQLGPRPTKSVGVEAGQPINIVVLGSDTRAGQSSSYGGSKFAGAQRSDTVILVHLSGDRQWATAVSIPRDTYIAMPDCKLADGKVSKGWSDKFNVTYARGGAACVITAIEAITGIYIDHYVEVNFGGFVRVVDAVGGVPVCVTKAVNDPKAQLKLPAGTSVLNGAQAIKFVRARKTLGDGSDISRIRRQQDFLASLAKKVISAQTLLNPVKLINVINGVAESVTTDPELSSLDGMQQLAVNMSQLRPSTIRFITAPHIPAPGNPADVVFAPLADELWQALRTDSPWPKPADNGFDGKPLTADPSSIHLQVFNGTKTSGLAGKKSSLFKSLGYRVDKVGNSPAELGKATAIYASAKQANAARTLAKALGIETVLPMPKGVKIGLAVVVGAEWTDPVAVRVKTSPTESLYGPTEGRAADETTCSPA